MGIFNKIKNRKAKTSDIADQTMDMKVKIEMTRRKLERKIKRLKTQEEEYLNIARNASAINDKKGYLAARSGWKINKKTLSILEHTLIKIELSKHLSETTEISRLFTEEMGDVVKHLKVTSEGISKKMSDSSFEEILSELDAIQDGFESGIDVMLQDNGDTRDDEKSLDENFEKLVKSGKNTKTTSESKTTDDELLEQELDETEAKIHERLNKLNQD